MSDRAAAIGIILFIAFVGLLLRLTGMRGDIWFEEAWTLETLQRLENPSQILKIYRHHTNHLLNSIVLHFLPPLQADLVYRLPATAASIAAVPVFWAFAQRQMGNFSFGACLMFALSVPVVAYSTEARGYAFLILFSLIALLALDANLREEDWRLTALYWLATILAFLSHPTAVVFFGAVFLWSLSVDLSARFTRTIEIIGKCHLVPIAVGILIYFHFYAVIPPESLGAPEPFAERLISALSVGVGGPEYLDSSFGGVSLARIIAGTVGILLLIEIYLMVVTGARYWSLYFLGIFVLPYVCYIFPVVRTSSSAYFLLPTVLIYLVLGNFLARLMEAGFVSRTFAVLLAGLFCYGTITTFQGAFDIGRGRVRRAFEYMALNSQGAEVSIAGDDDIGNDLLIGFYLPRLTVSKPIIYRTASEVGAAQAEWYLVRHDKLTNEVDHEVVMSGGRQFELKKVFRRMLPAGTNLYVYQRLPD